MPQTVSSAAEARFESPDRSASAWRRRDAWLQARDDVRVVRVSLAGIGRAFERQRPPDVDALALREAAIAAADVLEALGHDADDREGTSAQAHLAAEHVRVRLEPPAPERVADYRDAGVAALFAPCERAPERGPHAKHGEVVRRDLEPAKRLGAILERQLQIGSREAGDAVERAVVVAIRQERVLPDGECRNLGQGLVDPDQAIRRRIWKWRQQHAVDQAEDRRRGADADGERQQGDRRESRVAAQHPRGVHEVLAELVEPRQAALIADGLGDLFGAAQPLRGATARVLGRRAAPAFELLLHVEVKRQLVPHLVVAAAAADRSEQPRDPGDESAHGYSADPRRRLITPATSVHCSRSAASCRRPAGVML
jgi:hypothetical protein